MPSSAALPIARFRPRITLQTLGRGDGLLGMRPQGPFGPRGDRVTLACIDWTYTLQDGRHWETPAPTSVLAPRPEQDTAAVDGQAFARDLSAEAVASDTLWSLGLHPVAIESLQWRSEDAAPPHAGPFWSLLREEDFGDFWAERLPALQAEGWAVVVRPGFAHESVPVVPCWTC